MLKFSPANTKIKKLKKVAEISGYLEDKKKIYSFDLLSGWTCPAAKDCMARAIINEDGKRRIKDGKDIKFRCFSASQEVLLTGVYNLRKHNMDSLKGKSEAEIYKALKEGLPKNAGIIRIHVAGDFFNQKYFDAWLRIIRENPDVLFYAYTKNLPLWIKRLDVVNNLANFSLTASYGGRYDNMIMEHKLRSATVVYSEKAAGILGLPVDDDDSHAAKPDNESFALVIHGTQPKGSMGALIIDKANKKKALLNKV